MVRRHGAQHGLAQYAAALQTGNVDAATRNDILALRTDPEISARMAAELTRENASQLQAQLGRAPSAGELYAAHVLGPAGAAKLIAAAAHDAPNAAALFPREAGANHGLFFANGQTLSAQALLDRFSLNADANFKTPVGHTAMAPASENEMMSPQLAQALFSISLLPLLNGGEDEQSPSDPLNALLAYTKASQA